MPEIATARNFVGSASAKHETLEVAISAARSRCATRGTPLRRRSRRDEDQPDDESSADMVALVSAIEAGHIVACPCTRYSQQRRLYGSRLLGCESSSFDLDWADVARYQGRASKHH